MNTDEIWDDVSRERINQICLGFTPAHDDAHTAAQLTDAAMAFVAAGDLITLEPVGLSKDHQCVPEELWPWEKEGFKRCETARENYIIAITLLVAEVERLDRKHAREILSA
jgi:hypothetical protein